MKSTPLSRQPLDHTDPWKQFKHLVSAAMCEVGWPPGPSWHREDDGSFTPYYSGNLPTARFEAWCVDLTRAAEIAARATGVEVSFAHDWPTARKGEP